MSSNEALKDSSSKFTQVLDAALRIPSVRIDRAEFLRTSLDKHCTAEQIARAISKNPAAAGVPTRVIHEVANASITFETSKVTGISTLAGIPGGLAMVGTVPADLVQYFGHVLRTAQKLAYAYGWPTLFSEDGEEIAVPTESMLTLFVGVMFDVQLAASGVSTVSTSIAGQGLTSVPQSALTQEAVYPVVKLVAKDLDVSLAKQLVAGGVAKFIPVIGAVLSGGLTLATFLPMAKRLQAHLATLELTEPTLPTNPGAAL